MSAFLKYSQTRRAKVKQDNPDMSNTDVSRLLGEMWRNASPRERSPYVEQEERERARSGFFDNLRVDSFDEQTKKNTFGQYINPNQTYQQYRHPYNASSGGMFK
mmetsp:Transcript_42533/g.102862  ORF Transcript_42533/g.102862 Transcript_42533/m.102862 type:complete len:104 (+) Transcript_42533:31-342(+)